MPVKAVELVLRHDIEQLLDPLFPVEMPGLVQHEAPPGEAGTILNRARVHFSGPDQLAERLLCIETAGIIRRTDDDVSAPDPDFIGLRAE